MTIGIARRTLFAAALCGVFAGIACRTNESPEAQVDDLQIATQIKAKLASDIGPSSVTNISVNSTNGVVTMSGQVDSTEVKSKALEIAKAVPKVVRVVDSIQVVSKPSSLTLPRHRIPARSRSPIAAQPVAG